MSVFSRNTDHPTRCCERRCPVGVCVVRLFEWVHCNLLMSLLHLYRNYPQLSLCSLLVAGLGILASLLYLSHTDRLQHQAMQEYGQMLATSAAQQAVDATLTQDLVSLQALLQDVSRSPHVVGATLHNVENRLLVQNGHRPDQGVAGKRYHFTAPVAVHNNIAGYLQVTLEMPRYSALDKRFLVIWLIAVAFALLMIWWSVQLQWWKQLRDQLPSPGKLMHNLVETLPTIPEAPPEPQPVTEPAPPPPRRAVRLTVELTNLQRLYQQLHREGFANLLRRFDQQLREITLLHDGKLRRFEQDTLLIDFISEHPLDCTFRALCCARLLHGVCARAGSPRLQLAAAITTTLTPEEETSNSLLHRFMTEQQPGPRPQKGETLIEPGLISDDLRERVELEAGHLLSFRAPYKDLLQRQENQLASH